MLRDSQRLLDEFGWHQGDFFRGWIGDLIDNKVGDSEATFRDVECLREACEFKDMYFIGTNLSTTHPEIFSAYHTPDMCIADAVRISMSIPLFFAAVRSAGNDVYVDGGLLNNYPIKLFDDGETNYETLGFRLDSKKEISVFSGEQEPDHTNIEDFFDFTKALLRTILNIQQTTHLREEDWNRTVFLDTLGVDTVEFDLSNKQKLLLIESGRQGATKYFKWLDNLPTE